MEDARIVPSLSWVSVMLTYLVGDVPRRFSGDATPGPIGGSPASQRVWLGLSILLVLPTLMVLVTLRAPNPANRRADVGVAVLLFPFYLVGLPAYESSRSSS